MSGLHIARSCEIPVRKKTERGWGSLVTTQHIWVKLSGTKIYTLHSPTLSNIYYPSASAALWINSQSLEDAHHVHLNVGHLVYLHFGHHVQLHVGHFFVFFCRPPFGIFPGTNGELIIFLWMTIISKYILLRRIIIKYNLASKSILKYMRSPKTPSFPSATDDP